MSLDLPFYTRYADGFRVGDWTVVPRANELSRPGETVHVEPKPMHVLTLLAEHAGETVTRDALLEAVWPEVYVTENALSRCISQLRKVFGDDARAPRVIETIPTIGYRLVAPVYPIGDGVAVLGASSEVALTVPGEHRSTAPEVPSQEEPGAQRSSTVLWAGIGVVLALASLGLAVWLSRPAAPVPTTRPLTSLPGLETGPALSPDGSRVLYTHSAYGNGGNLFVEVIGEGPPLQLTDGPASDRAPTWAPDGRSVAFVRCEDNACRLYSVPALGGEARRLDEGPTAPWGLSYTPDGRTIGFATRVAPTAPFHLAVLDVETGDRRVLTTPPPTSYGDLGPVVSPDGTALVFRRRTGAGGEDLYRLNFGDEQAEPERLTHDSRSLAGYAWTPDGREVLFSSNRTGMYELWRIAARGGTPERVRGHVARDPGQPTIGGGQLVFEEWAFEINLWTAAVGDTEAQPLVTSTWWDKHPHLGPDGTRLAFISNRSGPPEVWLAGADGATPTRRTSFDGASVEAPRWSPDGERLAFQARPDTEADLYVIDAAGGPPRALTSPGSDEVLPRWSRDGERIYFGSNRDGSWQLWAMPADGGEAVRITDAGGYVGEESVDGTEVLYTKFGEAGLWARPVGGGRERLVTDALGPAAVASWAVASTGLFFPGSQSTLLRLDPATGMLDTLAAPRGRLTPSEPGLTVSADGQRVVYAQTDRVESDLMLVTPFE